MRVLAIVTRKSTADEQRVSVTRQEAMGREWAAGQGITDLEVYADNEASGVDMERDRWRSFCDDVRGGVVDVVWCYEQSRLTRAGSATWDEVAVMLAKAGIAEVHTQRQGRIGVAEGNRLQGRLQAVIDQEERERAIVRSRDGLVRSAAEGRPPGGRPSGYLRMIDGGRTTLVPDPATAAVVVEVVNRVAAGEALAQIARSLNERSVPTSRGGKVWTSQHIRSMASAPTSAGLRVHRGSLTEGTWPAIVDRGTWERARQVLGDTRTVVDVSGKVRRVPRTHRLLRRWLLTGGLAVCGECGAALVAASRGSRDGARRPIYQCHPNAGGKGCVAITADPFESDVMERLFELLTEGRVPTPDRDDERVAAHDELGGAKRRMRELAEDYAAGYLDESSWRSVRATAASAIRFAERKVEALRSADVSLDDLEERWPAMSVPQRRLAVEQMIERVTVNRAAPGTRRHDPARIVVRWRV